MHAVKQKIFILFSAIALSLLAGVCLAAGIPDTISIDSIQQYYNKVGFNHAAHITMLKDCGVCHHHTTGAQVVDPACARCHKNSGAQPVVSCRGCHKAEPFTSETLSSERQQKIPLYHKDKPGLKGAYHLSCLGCHEKMGGPTGCQDCHTRNDSGDALYHAGKYAPKTVPGKSEEPHH